MRRCHLFNTRADIFRSVLQSKLGGSATYTLAFGTPGGNLRQPPASLVGAIITGVPGTVLADLVRPEGRSSIASQFRAGNTPLWYQTLPVPVKSYIESLATQIAAGEVDLKATPSAFSFPVEADPATSTAVGGAAASSTSKAMAAQGTGGIALSLAAAIGVLGVAIAL